MRIQMRGVVTQVYSNPAKGYGNFTLRGYRDGDLLLNVSPEQADNLKRLDGAEVDLKAEVIGELVQNSVKLKDGSSFNVSSAKLTVKALEVTPVPEPAVTK